MLEDNAKRYAAMMKAVDKGIARERKIKKNSGDKAQTLHGRLKLCILCRKQTPAL